MYCTIFLRKITIWQSCKGDDFIKIKILCNWIFFIEIRPSPRSLLTIARNGFPTGWRHAGDVLKRVVQRYTCTECIRVIIFNTSWYVFCRIISMRRTRVSWLFTILLIRNLFSSATRTTNAQFPVLSMVTASFFLWMHTFEVWTHSVYTVCTHTVCTNAYCMCLNAYCVHFKTNWADWIFLRQ